MPNRFAACSLVSRPSNDPWVFPSTNKFCILYRFHVYLHFGLCVGPFAQRRCEYAMVCSAVVLSSKTSRVRTVRIGGVVLPPNPSAPFGISGWLLCCDEHRSLCGNVSYTVCKRGTFNRTPNRDNALTFLQFPQYAHLHLSSSRHSSKELLP
jgi:hypothetical protein